MRKSTRRTARVTATVAGVAALGAVFVGTAEASSFGYHGHAPSDPHGRNTDTGSGLGGFTNQSFGDYMSSFGTHPDDTYDNKSFCGTYGRTNGEADPSESSRGHHDDYGYTYGDGHGKGSHYSYNKGENCKHH